MYRARAPVNTVAVFSDGDDDVSTFTSERQRYEQYLTVFNLTLTVNSFKIKCHFAKTQKAQEVADVVLNVTESLMMHLFLNDNMF